MFSGRRVFLGSMVERVKSAARAGLPLLFKQQRSGEHLNATQFWIAVAWEKLVMKVIVMALVLKGSDVIQDCWD
ncbi:MAG: hypothetical protein RL240_3250 [Planctomycetota bacterium]